MSLLSPTKLNTVSFSAIERLRPGVEFDLLAVVSNCSALQYTTDLSKPFREAIVIDQRVEDNEQMLISYTLRSSSASTSSLTLALFEDVVFPISIISDLSSQTFPVEGKISLPDRPQFFYLLTCSHYNHFVRIKTKKMVQYFNCKLERMLVPRCHFEVNITNTSDIISAIVSETIAETMLSLTSEQIYENVVAQLQKPSYRFPDQTPSMLAVTSFTEPENPATQALPSPMAPEEIEYDEHREEEYFKRDDADANSPSTKKLVKAFYIDCYPAFEAIHFFRQQVNYQEGVSCPRIMRWLSAKTDKSAKFLDLFNPPKDAELTSKRGLIPSKRILFPSTPLEIRAKRRRRVISRALSSIQKSKIATPLSVCCTEKRTISKREQHELKKSKDAVGYSQAEEGAAAAR
ncbi:hypothetical protein FXO38_02671 [Capsicum annuum]|nr:hypothetical protein FXO38_02671 [Capsicum annuum]KAF3681589.1 hypothetical protein FXO37_02836 [Capsicum annuum]